MRLERYQEFVRESAGKMQIIYSEAFRHILTYIAANSPEASEIGRKLLEIESGTDDYVDDYTLIDKTDKNDMISYVQSSRFYREHPDQKEDLPKMGRYSDVVKNSKFWTSGRTPEYGIGRWVRHIYKDVLGAPIENASLEAFVNAYKSTHDSMFSTGDEFELVKGEDIRHWYLVDNYLEESGQLGNSCMRYARCQEFLDIYVNNPESCQLLILKSAKDPEKIIGRALVWTLHDGPGVAGRLFMDRVYTIKDSDRIRFQEYAKKNQILTGATSAYKIKVKEGGYDYYPYMDTFSSLDRDKGILSTDLSNQDAVELRNTDGTCSDLDGRVWSDFDGEYIDEDDARWCADIDGYAHYESTVWLEYIDKYVTERADTTYSEWDERSYYSDDTVWSEAMNDSLWKELDLIRFQTDEKGSTDWCPSEAHQYYIEIDGRHYSRSEYIKDPYTGEYAWKNDEMKARFSEEFGSEWSSSLDGELRKALIDTVPSAEAMEELKIVHKRMRRVPEFEHMLPALYAFVYLDLKGTQRYGSQDAFRKECEEFAGEMRYKAKGTKENRYRNTHIERYYYDLKLKGWQGDYALRSIREGLAAFDLSLLPERIYKLVLFRDLMKRR